MHGDSVHDYFVKEGEKHRTNCTYKGCECTQYKENMYSLSN